MELMEWMSDSCEDSHTFYAAMLDKNGKRIDDGKLKNEGAYKEFCDDCAVYHERFEHLVSDANRLEYFK